MKTYQLPAVLEGFRTSKGDLTLHLTFGTQEITPEQMANIHHSLNKYGFFAFAPDPFATHELEEIDNLKVEYDDSGKSASQRLKAVFYVWWQQANQGYEVFNDFYIAQMEKLITHFKSKLDA